MTTKPRWNSIPANLKDRVVDQDKPAKKASKSVSGKPSKYHNVKVKFDGHTFDSIREKDFYIALLMRKKAGEIFSIELQPEYPYEIQYYKPMSLFPGEEIVFLSKMAVYIADFKVTYRDAREETIDVKGVRTRVYKQKKRIIEKLYGIKIIEK